MTSNLESTPRTGNGDPQIPESDDVTDRLLVALDKVREQDAAAAAALLPKESMTFDLPKGPKLPGIEVPKEPAAPAPPQVVARPVSKTPTEQLFDTAPLTVSKRTTVSRRVYGKTAATADLGSASGPDISWVRGQGVDNDAARAGEQLADPEAA